MILKNISNEHISISDTNLALELPPTQQEEVDITLIKKSTACVERISKGRIVFVDITGKELTTEETLKVLTSSDLGVFSFELGTGKLLTHDTARPFGSVSAFWGSADSITTPEGYGDGEIFAFSHEVGNTETSTISKSFDFNTINNNSYCQEMRVFYDCPDFVLLTVSVVPRVIKTVAGSNTNFKRYGNIIIPTIGDGTLALDADLSDPNCGYVKTIRHEDGSVDPGFFDANYNQSTKKMEGFTPNSTPGKGRFNLFAEEAILARWMIKIPLVGKGFAEFETKDIMPIGHGMKMKVTLETYGSPDFSWKVGLSPTIHRAKTI
jgi:hypothetical protein